MSFDFRKQARKSTTLSEILVDRTKISIEEVVKRFPDGVTISEFDFISTPNVKTNQMETYAVCAIKEDPSVCFFGGAVLNRVCTDFTAGFGGDVEATSKALNEYGGVKVKFEQGKTRSGNNVTKVIVV